MIKFKVGDRVKVVNIDPNYVGYQFLGKVGDVNEDIYSSHRLFLVIFECGTSEVFKAEELELVSSQVKRKKLAIWLQGRGL